MKTKISCKSCLSRRQAVGNGAKLSVFVVTGSAALSASCGSETKSGGDSGQAVSVDSSGKVSLEYTKYPDLQNVGGSVRLSVNGTPVSVTRTSSSEVVAIRAVCTHEGGTLNGYSGGSFKCPLHGATFSADGTVTGGPARSKLRTYQTVVTSTGVTVTVA